MAWLKGKLNITLTDMINSILFNAKLPNNMWEDVRPEKIPIFGKRAKWSFG